MSKIQLSASDEHEAIKKKLAKSMESQYGYTITHMADSAPRYPEPPKVGRHIPDIMAEKTVNNIMVKAVGEAESCSGLGTEDTKEQIEDYRYESSGFEFFFGVPDECCDDSKALLTKLKISWGPDKKNHHYCYKR